MQLRRRSFKGFDKLFSDWMGTVDVIKTGEQKNKAAMLETISNVIKFVTSMQISDGRNLALEDYRWAVCSCNSWKWRGCHLSCSAGRRQRRHPLNRWRHHPHQNLPCSYSSVGPGRLRRSRWASRHVSETSFPKRESFFAYVLRNWARPNIGHVSACRDRRCLDYGHRSRRTEG